MKNIAVIPARGGSKRIPRKNIRSFLGKPMIAYSIEAALKTGLFHRVIVSTDDNEIAEIAQTYGAETPFVRPKELSCDYSGTMEVIQHTINWLLKNDEKIDEVCCIYATAPFVQQKEIKQGFEILKSSSWQYVFSATRFDSPVFRGFKRRTDQGIEMLFPEHYQDRSQDLPEIWHDAGQFYWGKLNAWLEGLAVFEPWSTMIELPRWRVQDIDTIDDWQRAEIIHQLMQNQFLHRSMI